MAYWGNEPAKVAVKVGANVITTAEIQDGQVYTADILDDAITAQKVDDDGTGFRMGSLGLGAAVSGSEKLTVGGTASFSGAITGNLTGNASGTAATVTGAAQSAITSVGTLTGLTLSGTLNSASILANNNSTIQWECHDSNADSRSWGWQNDVSAYGDFILKRSDARDNTLDTDTLNIDKFGTFDINSGRMKFGGHWLFEEVSDQKVRIGEGMNNGLEIFQDMEWYGEGKAKIENTAGSESTPTYSFNSDTDTGMYRGAANTLRFATGGAERIEVTSAQTKVTGKIISTDTYECRNGHIKIQNTNAASTNSQSMPGYLSFEGYGWDTNSGSDPIEGRITLAGSYSGITSGGVIPQFNIAIQNSGDAGSTTEDLQNIMSIKGNGLVSINSGLNNEKLYLEGTTQPLMRWREGTTNKAYIQWQDDGKWLFCNQEHGGYTQFYSDTLQHRCDDGLGSQTTIKHYSKDGTYSGDVEIEVHHSSYHSSTYEIHVSGYSGSSGYFVGSYYQNGSIYDHTSHIADTNGTVGSLTVAQIGSGHGTKFTVALTGDCTHPVVYFKITSGNAMPAAPSISID